MPRLLLALLLAFPAVLTAADVPCADDPAADFCGPGEAKPVIPGLFDPPAAFPSRGPVFQAEESSASARAAAPSPVKAPPPAPRPRLRAAGPGEAGPGLMIFYTYDCPHCREAIRWAAGLDADYPGLALEKYEVKQDADNRAFMAAALAERGAAVSGFPTIVVGEKVLVGFSSSRTPGEIKAELDRLYGRRSSGCRPRGRYRCRCWAG